MTTRILGGHFQIIKRLGGGSFGQTYLAENIQQFGHQCVVKQLRSLADRPATFELIKNLFEREAKALYEIGCYHDQIPSLIAYFEENRQFYLVQEFIEGHDLTQELTQGKQLPESEVIELLENILKPLAFLHQNKVIHRDIKPSNLMRRNQDGKIILIDFGAIKELSVTQIINTQGETKVGTIIGTAGYMPSEQGLGKPKFSSDIYAAGIIAIQALTGLKVEQLEENPETGELVWQHRVQVTPEFSAILEKMVRYHFRERYPTANEALKAVQELSGSSSKTINPVSDNNRQIVPFKLTSQGTEERITGHNLAENNPIIAGLMKRRRLLKWSALIGAGVGIAFVERSVFDFVYFNHLSSPEIFDLDLPILPAKVKLEKFDFEVVNLDKRGHVIKRSARQAQYFAEDLGNGIALEMVAIPGGTFIMGSPRLLLVSSEKGSYDDERPQHKVTVPPFFMSKFPVTQAQWRAVANLPKVDRNLKPDPSYFKGDRLPVESVNWYDAVEFCQRLSQKTGRKYRLPSEAKWEYAARAGTTTPFYFGETITSELANYDGNYTYASESKGEYREKTTPVGSFVPNAFGLYDMHGLIWEWCADTWHENYHGAPTDGSAWLKDGNEKRSTLRGGSWLNNPQLCRSAVRVNDNRIVDSNLFGFRVEFVVTTA
ncbi:MAG: SUMF1/EgtB/PvdO family nonheme iron enzyme [Prochloraceae cyanobacterium]